MLFRSSASARASFVDPRLSISEPLSSASARASFVDPRLSISQPPGRRLSSASAQVSFSQEPISLDTASEFPGEVYDAFSEKMSVNPLHADNTNQSISIFPTPEIIVEPQTKRRDSIARRASLVIPDTLKASVEMEISNQIKRENRRIKIKKHKSKAMHLLKIFIDTISPLIDLAECMYATVHTDYSIAAPSSLFMAFWAIGAVKIGINLFLPGLLFVFQSPVRMFLGENYDIDEHTAEFVTAGAIIGEGLEALVFVQFCNGVDAKTYFYSLAAVQSFFKAVALFGLREEIEAKAVAGCTLCCPLLCQFTCISGMGFAFSFTSADSRYSSSTFQIILTLYQWIAAVGYDRAIDLYIKSLAKEDNNKRFSTREDVYVVYTEDYRNEDEKFKKEEADANMANATVTGGCAILITLVFMFTFGVFGLQDVQDPTIKANGGIDWGFAIYGVAFFSYLLCMMSIACCFFAFGGL